MQLSTYNAGRVQQPFTFYILCKGNNSGRPMAEPCPNCFTCSCDSAEEKDFYFWLCFGLWKGKLIEPLLCGSVIPFVRIGDMRKEMQRQAGQLDRSAYVATISQLLLIEEKTAAIKKQLQLMMQLQTGLIRQHMQW
jgi:hypothetical protein